MPSNQEVWSTEDPRGYRVRLYQSTVDARERMAKHVGPDAMTVDEAREVVEQPHVIQVSSSDPHREVYYVYEQERGKPPYKRMVVAFEDTETSREGAAISWSRYSKMVSGNVVYIRRGGHT